MEGKVNAKIFSFAIENPIDESLSAPIVQPPIVPPVAVISPAVSTVKTELVGNVS